MHGRCFSSNIIPASSPSLVSKTCDSPPETGLGKTKEEKEAQCLHHKPYKGWGYQGIFRLFIEKLATPVRLAPSVPY